MSLMCASRNGVIALPWILLGVCLCDCLIDDLVHVIGVHRILLGDGVADDGAALQAHVPLGLHDLCHGLFILAVVVQLVAGGAAVERGQLVGAKTENRHAVASRGTRASDRGPECSLRPRRRRRQACWQAPAGRRRCPWSSLRRDARRRCRRLRRSGCRRGWQ